MEYTTKEAATILGISAGTLRVYLHYGKIKGIKRGRDWFISQETVDQLKREMTERKNHDQS